MKIISVAITTAVLLFLWEFCDAQNVEYVASVPCANINDVRLIGTYAYCVSDEGLTIINVTDPYSPSRTGQLSLPGQGNGIFVTGSFAYLADGTYGLQIVDISDRANPNLVGNYDTPDIAIGVFISATYAFVADAGSGLQIIDISNRANPTLAGAFGNTAGSLLGVYVSGNYAYLVEGLSGLQILDISDLANPSPLGAFDTPGYANYIFISGHYAYIADESAGLQIINISNPAIPSFTGSYQTPAWANGVYISGQYAYLADSDAGLQIVDIANPSSPSLAGQYDTLSNASGVAVSGSYIYIADQDSLKILRYSPAGINEGSDLPNSFTLLQNYPNPFNSSTLIRFSLPYASNVKLDVYNILGQRITTLFNNSLRSGYYSVPWNAGTLASGLYFFRLSAGRSTQTRQMMLLK